MRLTGVRSSVVGVLGALLLSPMGPPDVRCSGVHAGPDALDGAGRECLARQRDDEPGLAQPEDHDAAQFRTSATHSYGWSPLPRSVTMRKLGVVEPVSMVEPGR